MPNLSKTDQSLIDSLTIGTESETVKNRFSGESCELDARGVALYDFVVGCEALGFNTKLRNSLRIFRTLYPNEYYVLLD